MVGLLQIIIVMGCIYMLLKVIAIVQQGLAVPSENRAKANFYTIAGTIIGLAGAAFCFWLMVQQSVAIEPTPYWQRP
ncbi:hypothetical protein [Brevundimonas nasdae]|uniref:hypothetical protein n=1 Tax=Brevundimonas nasdae TaxID=172043 RepID=UPI0028991A65|nr:hypothetical protein [Brevundimonas nasdae]